MYIYVANATHQVKMFTYRLLEKNGLRAQTIPMGGQIKLPEDLSQEDANYVISQHALYGLIPAEEINRTRGFKGLCYSLGKPVAMEGIESLVEHNRNELVELGKKIRFETAAASNADLETNIHNMGLPGSLSNFDLSVEEEDRPDATATVSEGFVNDYSGVEPGQPHLPRARNRGRR